MYPSQLERELGYTITLYGYIFNTQNLYQTNFIEVIALDVIPQHLWDVLHRW
jgi:hypothetical protein